MGQWDAMIYHADSLFIQHHEHHGKFKGVIPGILVAVIMSTILVYSLYHYGKMINIGDY